MTGTLQGRDVHRISVASSEGCRRNRANSSGSDMSRETAHLWSQAKRANAFIKERQSEMNELVADLQMMISKAGIRR